MFANTNMVNAYAIAANATNISREIFSRSLGSKKAPMTAPTPMEATRMPNVCGPPFSRFLANSGNRARDALANRKNRIRE